MSPHLLVRSDSTDEREKTGRGPSTKTGNYLHTYSFREVAPSAFTFLCILIRLTGPQSEDEDTYTRGL